MKMTKKLIIIIIGLSLIAGGVVYYFTKSKLPPKSSLDEITTYSDFLGRQKPIDTTIKKAYGIYQHKNTENTYQSFYKNSPLTKNAIKFTNSSSSISFFTLANQSFGSLSEVTPTSNNNTLTYNNIHNHTDLRYTVNPTTLLEEFIVSDSTLASAINEISQQASVNGITAYEEKNGSIIFKNKDKASFIIPPPVMYEQNNSQQRSNGIRYEIKELEKNSYEINKVITEEGKAWLSDPARIYPIVIDLVIDNADLYTGWESSDPTNLVVSQETTIKQEGSGSLKLQTADVSTTNVDLMEYASSLETQTTYVGVPSTLATGGTITTYSGYTVHSFTSGSSTFTPDVNLFVDYLVLGGGAGGGGWVGNARGSGGGGAGGLLTDTATLTASQELAVTVGAGGGNNTSGGNSVFGELTAIGGGRGGGLGSAAGGGGGSGGGGFAIGSAGGAGTTGQGNNGGAGSPDTAYYGGGGGGGKSVVGQAGTTTKGGNGGAGIASSITGTSLFYAGGGGGGCYNNAACTGGGTGGSSIGGAGTKTTTGGSASPANRGSGGGGCQNGTGGTGSAGTVIVSYAPVRTYSESSIKTQGSYSLKGVAYQTISLNKSLTQTFGSPLDLTNAAKITLDMRASRTGSNIKLGLHDSGGTTTELTPNVTQADTFQTVTWDLSAVADANKDAIDQLIITVVNADAENTFYLDSLVATISPALNDTATLTASSTDLSGYNLITFWVRSSTTGSFLTFQFGESDSSEQSTQITISSADTWEQKTWDISGIAAADRNGVTKFAFKMVNSEIATVYIDDIRLSSLAPPTIGVPEALSDTSIRWNFFDNAAGETGFKLYDSSEALAVTCAAADLTYCDETGLTPNTQYTRKAAAYGSSDESGVSASASKYTLAAVPSAPAVSGRTATTVDINLNPATNPAATTFAIYKEEGIACDGSGGSYIAADGSDNGATAVWQTDAVWDTVTATGLSSEKSYVFCVKAKNAEDAETGWSALGAHNVGYIPVSGDYIYTSDTAGTESFATRYVNGNNTERYVLGVDNGGNPNTAKFEVRSGILTINATDTLAVGSLELTGGSVVIADGGVIEIGKAVWIVDADDDGYAANNWVYIGDQPANGKRKNLATSLAAADCNDAIYITSNICFTTATGGTVTTDGNYKIHTFTSSGTFTVTGVGPDNNFDYLVVGGGGGAGFTSDNRGGGGAGGGGMREDTLTLTETGDYTVVVGAGGAGSTTVPTLATNGADSQFHTITSIGGGRGGRGDDASPTAGSSGGSGGGSGANAGAGGAGTAGQGNNGGAGQNNYGGGGGGAGGVGGAGSISDNRGPGLASTTFGGTFAAGGDGGQRGDTRVHGVAGTANTGNGGSAGVSASGQEAYGGNGGKGIVIIRYLYQ
jgi:hypothetical protein